MVLSGVLIALAFGLQGSGRSMIALVITAALVPVLIMVERRAVDPVIQLSLFGRWQNCHDVGVRLWGWDC